VDIKDIMTIAIGFLSACAAILAAIYTRQTIRHQRRASGTAMNWELLVRSNSMLIQNHELVEFYGINKCDMEKDGLTAEQLVFIFSNFAAGAALHRISGDSRATLTSYRMNFLSNAKVRLAWKKYIRGKMLGDGPFATAVDNYIAEKDKAEGLFRAA